MKLVRKPNVRSASDTTGIIQAVRRDRIYQSSWLVQWVADNQLYLTGLVVPFLLFRYHFPLWLQVIGWFLLSLPWVCRLVSCRYLTYPTLVDPLLLVFTMLIPAGLFASVNLQQSFNHISQLAIGVSVFYGLANVHHGKSSLWLPVTGLVLVTVGLAFAAPLIVTWSSSLFFFEQAYSQLKPVVSESLDANIMATILSMTLLVLGALVWRGEFAEQSLVLSRKLRLRPNLVLGASSLILLSAQLFTQSRGAAAGLAIGFCTLLILYRQRLLLIALSILLGIAAIAESKIGLGAAIDLLLSAGPGTGWASRQEVWSTAIHMLRSVPFTGVGLGSFPQQAGSLLFPFWGDWEPTHAHNLFLQVGVDLGIPGLVAYVGIVTSCLIMAWQAWRAFRRACEQNLEALSAGVFAALIAMITHGLVDAPLWGTKPSVVAWYFMGLAAMLFVHSQHGFEEVGDSDSAA